MIGLFDELESILVVHALDTGKEYELGWVNGQLCLLKNMQQGFQQLLLTIYIEEKRLAIQKHMAPVREVTTDEMKKVVKEEIGWRS